MRRLEGWAPPGRVWGPWIDIASLVGGPLSYKIDFDTISDAPSTFDAEMKYWSGPSLKQEIIAGPGSHSFTAGVCVCVHRIRFRSHTLGQIIRAIITP